MRSMRVYWRTEDFSFQAVLVSLPCRAKDPLDWKEALRAAEQTAASGLKIVWEIDCGLGQDALYLREELPWNAIALALELFTKEILPKHASSIAGVCLYRGPADIEARYVWTPQDADFIEENKTRALSREKLFTLHIWNVFAEYLKRMLSLIPETVPALALFDLKEGVSAELMPLLFSKERFEHFQLAFKDSPCWLDGGIWNEKEILISSVKDNALGIAVPLSERLSENLIKKFSEVLTRLHQKNLSYRLIPEADLHLEWHGIESLIFFAENISNLSKRGLMGFYAGGGALIYGDQALGFEEETSFDAWLKEIGAEGFEPPTYCSQSSRASQTALCSDQSR